VTKLTVREATFRDRYGLHPRSAHRIQEALAGKDARVTIEDPASGRTVDAGSMLSLISAAIPPGTRLRIHAEGAAAEAAADALAALFEAGVCHP
jgi:phosphotransferase system HPr (HPr) family protein